MRHIIVIAKQPDRIGMKITFRPSELPILVEWKMISEGDYVLGIEPSTNYPEGFVNEKKRNAIQQILPFENKKIHLQISVFHT